jgi:branched-subunit amino acid ABC-type transport system permease component
MRSLLPFLIVGLVTGSLYGLAGVGLVLTYRTSGVFNFGHGALAAAAAYIFYTLHVTHGLAWPLAAVLSVFAFGTAAGVAIEFMTRRLVGAPEALVTVATVGLLLAIDGLLFVQFGVEQRRFPQFLPNGGVVLSGVRVSYAQMISVAVAAGAVAGLYVFLRTARLGVAMRGVVDNPKLLALSGTTPVRVRVASWVIGSVFASLSGVLLAPTLSLDANLLTLLVVQAFGACAIGLFSSLPLTYVGGLVVGIIASVATKYMSARPPFNGIPSSVPFLVLITILLIVPASKFPASARTFLATKAARSGRRARPVAALTAMGLLALLAVPSLAGPKLPVWIGALIMLIMFASLSLLVWTSGQISLCHTAFAALGATTLSHLTVDHGVPWGVALVLAGLSAIPVGALVALPAIRLSGVYLALVTFGLAILMQNVIYPSALMFAGQPFRTAARPTLGFIDGTTDKGLYYIILAITVASCALLVAVNRGRIGRLLRGMSETPTMLSTFGLSVNITRVIVFCISAFFAGIAGGLMITQTSGASAVTFIPLQSLLWLAVLAFCGTRLIGSSALAAAVFAILPAYLTGFTNEQQTLIFGVTAIVASIIVANLRPLGTWIRGARAASDRRRELSPVRARGHAVTVEVPS